MKCTLRLFGDIAKFTQRWWGMRGKKAKEDNYWLEDTNVIRLPDDEEFLNFHIVDDRVFILSNKSIYEIVKKEGVFGCVARKLKNCVRKSTRIGRHCN
jgi:hypothetical protein